MSAPQFSDLISQALLQQGPGREQAEQQLVNIRDSDYKNYLIESVKVIVNQSYQGNLRQAAGTLIKSSAATLDKNGKINWDHVEEGIQKHAKDALVSTLIDKDPLARRAAADAISTICSIELPRNKWTDLIQNLANNTNHTDIEIKKTAITTLGFICEKLKDSSNTGSGFQLQDNVIENILMGIINGMNQDQTDVGIKTASITALRNSIGYLQVYLDRQQVRDFVLNKILECLVNQDEDVTVQSLQTLIEFCKYQYNNLETYMQQIYNVLQPHLQSKKEELITPATEVFNTLATEYREREEQNAMQKVNSQQLFNANYCLSVKDGLVQLLLQNLLINDEDNDDCESVIQQSTEQTLNSVVEALGGTIIPTFSTFISNTAVHADWKYKQACCISFGCLLECQVEDQMKNMLFSSLSIFVKMLQEQNLNLVETAAKFLAKSADFHPEVFLKSPNLNTDLQIILTSLQQKPSISRKICWIFCFLSDALKQNPDSALNLQLTQVIEALMKNALRSDLSTTKDLSVIDVSFMGIMNLLHNSQQSNVSAQYIKHAIEHLKQSYNEPDGKRDNIQSGILATMHGSLLSIYDDIAKDNSQESQQMIQTIYELIIQHFKTKGDVDSDGLYIISAIATCTKDKFVQYLDGAWPYLNHALTKDIDGDLFKTAIGALADIAKACDKAFVKHLEILDKLMQCVTLPNFDRELKLHVYICMGDIILACKESTAPYIQKFQQTFQLGFDACTYLLNTQTPTEVEYAEQLQERLIEAYTCMLHGINNDENNPNQQLLSGFQSLLVFLQTSCDKKYKPTIDYIRSALTLIIDIANFYGQSAVQFVKTPLTLELMDNLKKFSHIFENQQIIQYAEKIYQNLQ